MNRFVAFMTALLVLAAIQAAVAALVITLAIMLLFYSVTRPRETLAFLGALTILGLANAQPAAFIVTVGVIALAVVIAGAWRKSRHRLLLTDGREHRPPGRRG